MEKEPNYINCCSQKKKKSVIFMVDVTTNHFALSFIVEN